VKLDLSEFLDEDKRKQVQTDPQAREDCIAEFTQLALQGGVVPRYIRHVLTLAEDWHGRAFAWEVRARIISAIGLNF